MLSKWNSHSFSVLDCQSTLVQTHKCVSCLHVYSLWVLFTWWGFCSLCFQHEPTELAHYSVLVSLSQFLSHFMALWPVFHSINLPTTPHYLTVLIYVLFLPFSSFQLYLFMNVSLSPDIILCSCLGSKHQLTYLHAYSTHEDHCAH